MGLKVLVTGGRKYNDSDTVSRVLSDIDNRKRIGLLVDGGSAGADFLACQWAKLSGIKTETYRANWDKLGRQAGPIRNSEMLEMHDYDLVVAFPGGRGTADMVRKAKAKGLTVVEVQGG